MSFDVRGRGESNKRRTREALSQAAVSIVTAEGMDALTADRIAEVAGVSRRTLFNYFGRVEEVLVASVQDTTRESMAALLARPENESLHDSAAVVLSDLIDSPVFGQALALERAAATSPATRRFLREFQETQTDAFAAALRARLGSDADDIYVESLAASLAGVLARITQQAFVDDPDADPLDPAVLRRLHDAFRRAIDLIFSGFPEAEAQNPKES